MLKENCGVIAGVGSEVSDTIYHGLRVIQHRGQESAGIATFNDGLILKIGSGLVHKVIGRKELDALSAARGIGHVRYSTTGGQDKDCEQPMILRTYFGEMALAHNGEIVNSDELRQELLSKGGGFRTHSDSEVMLKLLADKTASSRHIVDGIKEAMKVLVGSYSIALMIDERVFAIRDPLAIRPLCIGKIGDIYCAASESVVFDSLGGEFVRDILPGEIVEITKDGFESHGDLAEENTAHCFFEWIYFSRPDSFIEERLVYDVRRKVGIRLAEDEPVDADFVIPIPDSGRAHAIGYSEGSGIPYAEGLIKNRYVQRTFIMPKQAERESGVSLKLNPLKPVVEGKRVILVDDSIVRGTTMKRIVAMVKRTGAKEVHLRIGCPPIRSPCYLGIDIKNREEFIANGRSVDDICDFVGADSLAYTSIENLVDAIGHGRENLCLGCLTGEYPVDVPGERKRE